MVGLSLFIGFADNMKDIGSLDLFLKAKDAEVNKKMSKLWLIMRQKKQVLPPKQEKK